MSVTCRGSDISDTAWGCICDVLRKPHTSLSAIEIVEVSLKIWIGRFSYRTVNDNSLLEGADGLAVPGEGTSECSLADEEEQYVDSLNEPPIRDDGMLLRKCLRALRLWDA